MTLLRTSFVSARTSISSLPKKQFTPFRAFSSTSIMSSSAPPPERRFKNPAVFVCDIQEKFRPTIHEFDKVIATTTKLLRASHLLSLPIFVTTQNRARLGPTVSELSPHLSSSLVKADIDKTRFSMYLPPIPTLLSDKKAEVAIVGIESHICVTQTALDLLQAGHKVFVLADGVSSSNKEEVPIALARLRQAGAVITTSESWIYECMGDAAVPEFKQMVSLVKDTMKDTKASLQGLVPIGSKI
ncbi:putative hydrolase [Podospora australis]|uniref:Hydrolase n=1 Tax=Podospora australis TaxID=1536484 RepID=A0AAN7AKJ7_9PEZI|nr:putative hydrolase [Podospora australis]